MEQSYDPKLTAFAGLKPPPNGISTPLPEFYRGIMRKNAAPMASASGTVKKACGLEAFGTPEVSVVAFVVGGG